MAEASSAQRRRIPELDAVRALAMLAVLAVHVSARPVVELTVESKAYPLYILLNRLGAFAVPGFVFLSGLVLFHNYYGRGCRFDAGQVRAFYARRAAAVMAPYVLWSIAYHCLSLLGTHGWPDALRAFSVRDLAGDLLFGTAHYHLYFMVVSIQFYAAFPVLLRLLGRRSGTTAAGHAVVVGLGLQLALCAVASYVAPVPGKAGIAVSYLSHFMLGAYVALNYDLFTAWLDHANVSLFGRRIRAVRVLTAGWAVAGLLHGGAYYVGFGYGTWYDSMWYEILWSVYTFVSAPLLLHWGRIIYARSSPGVLRNVRALGAASFGIYLVHPALLAAWNRFVAPAAPSAYHGMIVAEFVAVTGASWGLVAAARRWLPYAWLVFGRAGATVRGPRPGAGGRSRLP